MAELSSTNIYGHLTVSGDVRVSSIIGKADVISIPTTVLMEHADFGQQLIVKRNSANSAAAITYENSSGILGRAGFAETGTYAIYYGTSTTAAWEIDASGVLQKGTIPWSRLSSVPSYASRWPSWSEVTSKPSTFTPSSHTHAAGDITSGTIAAARLPSASTSAAGIVQLSSATNSTSTTLAATASAVKAAYDLAASKWTYNESTIKAVKVDNAVAADQLATARTINGTSFNGTANITTANWGTARTITIGNTGKSVNGSANVSWSLSEIGAAPASHTHSYLPLGGGNLTGKLTMSALSDYGIRPSIELQGVHANDATNENSGAAIFFRTSTSAGYGPMISGIRRSGGAGALVFLTNTSAANSQTERMRITENGNVGIGTASPSYPLHVIGDVGFSGTLQAGTVPWARISGAPATATRWPAWSEVTEKPSTFAPSSHSHGAGDLPSATTSAKGVVQLSSATNSTSTTLAATASAVKAVYDTTVQALDAHAGTQATLNMLGHVHHATLTATLNTGGWTGTEAPFVQSQAVSGILATDVPIVDVVLSGDWEVDEARLEAWGYVYRIVTSNNSITAYASEKPDVALPLQLKVVR